ncbi:hypothetical protein CAPTEDRAFT_205079 [Capitella teleta]|uniref:Uncharacterized protein n=1 Tax=Capitella teleta TaxID=283909 RepID=R7TA05_CAPTE|nr:hypothetical protein CAPTEDRAFT_205079 [Capitella teleta]|eukprot:ELT90297.1 hypothetical protein CAPTEDRAFT_205079 [Capitella teleta]
MRINACSSHCPSRLLRSTNRLLLSVLGTKKKIGDRVFGLFGPKLWNNLPEHLRRFNSINSTIKNIAGTCILDKSQVPGPPATLHKAALNATAVISRSITEEFRTSGADFVQQKLTYVRSPVRNKVTQNVISACDYVEVMVEMRHLNVGGPLVLLVASLVSIQSASLRSAEVSALKRAPWQSYHWEDDKEKRDYNNEHAGMDDWQTPWASHEFDKRWASYDLRGRNNFLPADKRDPWAYPKTDIWSYISRRGKGRFMKESNKRTLDDEQSAKHSDYNDENADVLDQILASAKAPAKREIRSLGRTILDLASKRRMGRVKEPASVHPINMGLGQHAAGYALDTYSQLLADEQRRLQEGSSGRRAGGAPVRFIGK